MIYHCTYVEHSLRFPGMIYSTCSTSTLITIIYIYGTLYMQWTYVFNLLHGLRYVETRITVGRLYLWPSNVGINIHTIFQKIATLLRSRARQTCRKSFYNYICKIKIQHLVGKVLQYISVRASERGNRIVWWFLIQTTEFIYLFKIKITLIKQMIILDTINIKSSK